MKQETRRARRAQIEAAALALLVEQGAAATTMQAIARASRASIETLYNWYGDRAGLLRAMVLANTEELRQLLEQAAPGSALSVLEGLAPRLLALLTSDRLVALNRVAAGDEELGRLIAEAGRGMVAPLLTGLLARADAEGALRIADPQEATEILLGLLIGDLQVRRIVGRMPAPGPEEIAARAQRALGIIRRLWAVDIPQG